LCHEPIYIAIDERRMGISLFVQVIPIIEWDSPNGQPPQIWNILIENTDLTTPFENPI